MKVFTFDNSFFKNLDRNIELTKQLYEYLYQSFSKKDVFMSIEFTDIVTIFIIVSPIFSLSNRICKSTFSTAGKLDRGPPSKFVK